jgi:hypothetical protein
MPRIISPCVFTSVNVLHCKIHFKQLKMRNIYCVTICIWCLSWHVEINSYYYHDHVKVYCLQTWFLLLFLGWGATKSISYSGHCNHSRMIDEYGAVGGSRIRSGNRGTRRKPVLVPLLSTSNPTWPDLGLCRWRQPTNRLSTAWNSDDAMLMPVLSSDNCVLTLEVPGLIAAAPRWCIRQLQLLLFHG